MKIRLEPTGDCQGYPTVEIIIDGNDGDINSVWDELIEPALLAWGFQESTLDALFQEEWDYRKDHDAYD